MIENRATFFARFSKPPFCHLLTARDVTRIELMYVLSKYGHRGQTRKDTGGRYFEHPRSAALIIIDELQMADAETIILALGHDCDEDSTQVTADLIAEALGNDIGRKLRLLSKRGKTKDEYLPLLQQYGDWRTILVKAADRLHNLRTLPKDNPAFCQKQKLETRTKYLRLFRDSVAVQIQSATTASAINKLVEEIRTICTTP